MNQRREFSDLLNAAQRVYDSSSELRAFAPFPADIEAQSVTPKHRYPSQLLQQDRSLQSWRYADLQAAICAAAPAVTWRSTYPAGRNSARFMDRWGCFTIVGSDGPFVSSAARIFIVYMPAGLTYPWHQHPAEEAYFVIGGRALFKRQGRSNEILSEGRTLMHTSNQPHAIETTDSPVLCMVVWRTHLDTPPVLLDSASG